MKYFCCLSVFAILFLFVFTTARADRPKNVILFIGDGMGFEHVRAARLFTGEKLSFEKFPHQTEVSTFSADDNPIPDSAATGTAIATGVKVNNRVISQLIPGDGSDLETILEIFKERGKSTGLVTTVQLTDATPAVFAAHEPDRGREMEIAADYFRDSRPNVLFGGDDISIFREDAAASDYTVVTDVMSMNAVAAQAHTVDSFVYGGFGNYNTFGSPLLNQGGLPLEADEPFAQLVGLPSPFGVLGKPHLSEMTRAALDILGQNEKGFFLMVESGNIDRQSHFGNINDIFIGSAFGPQFSSISIITQEVIEFSKAVQVAVDWVRSRENGDDDDEGDDDDDAFDDTLILVTADHETAGLVVTADNGPGQLPDVEYTASFFDIGPDIGVPFPVLFFNHTGDNVPIYAIGKNALVFGTNHEFGRPLLDNTEILDRLLISKSNFRTRK